MAELREKFSRLFTVSESMTDQTEREGKIGTKSGLWGRHKNRSNASATSNQMTRALGFSCRPRVNRPLVSAISPTAARPVNSHHLIGPDD